MIHRLAILGASGDLTSRYLIPALVQLDATSMLPRPFSILAVARRDLGTEEFRRRVAAASAASASSDVLEMVTYESADVTDPRALQRALGSLDEPLAVYLALPPEILERTVDALSTLTLPEGSRVVVEKPFGEDVASAERLNALLHEKFSEDAIFRVDHFLAKQTVQNIVGLRFANRVFEPLWNREHIDRVEITWDETLALEGRASYYDSTGALKDMIQNHLLQLLCLVAMEPPYTLHPDDLRGRKVDVLRAVRRLSADEVEAYTVRGRYGAGTIGSRVTPRYVDEDGVDPERGTETFAQVTLFIDNWRWAGVPFALRTGKALGRGLREIAVTFRPVPHLAFADVSHSRVNVLRLTLDPDTMSLAININGPGDFLTLEATELAAELGPHELPAYARVLCDVLDGDTTLSIRDDEATEAWRIIEPIAQAWADGRAPLHEYPAGSDGPTGSGL